MPVQEALVLSLADLATPSGVSFQPPCKTREEDAAAWQQVLPGLTAQWNQGREIMALIQTRNTRQWSASARNYVYKPSEDYLIAAYSVAPSLGRPYTPGLCARHWVQNAAAAQTNGDADRGTIDMFLVFQCSPAGCKLSFTGVTRLMKFHQKNGASEVQAASTAIDAITDTAKFGWKGTFPRAAQWAAATPNRNRPRNPALFSRDTKWL